jgi:hypothetical protein
MDSTSRYALPYILPNQAQKHVTLNESLQALDVMNSLAVLSRVLAEQPASPADGDCYILPAEASGAAWSSFASGHVAAYVDGSWIAVAPPEGCRAWVGDENRLLVFIDDAWAPLAFDSLARIGINTDADLTNRLAVKSDAILFSHDDVTPGSGDVRQAINRAASAGTASILFETGYAAGAELGLIGSDDFEIRVSPDGETFATGMQVSAADGTVSFPAGFVSPSTVLTSLELRAALGSIADDTVATVDFGKVINGSVIMAVPNSLSSAPVALFFARMATSPVLTTLFSDGAAFTTQTGTLSGTTGEDGKINFAATDDGRFIVENRRGISIGYTLYTFLR